MNDPYAGLGTPATDDPYAGLYDEAATAGDLKRAQEGRLKYGAANVGGAFARGALDQGAGSMAEGALRLADTTARTVMGNAAEGEEARKLGATLGEMMRAEMQGPNERRREQIARVERRMAELKKAAEPKLNEIAASEGLKPAAAKVGEFRAAVREVYPVDRDVESSIPGQVIAGVGQALGGAPAYLTGLGLPASAGQMFDQGYADAKEKGADEATAVQSGVANLPGAALEQLGDKLQLGGMVKALRGGQRGAKAIGRDVVNAAGGEAGTEAAQTVYQNAVAAALYDPKRELTAGAGEAALVGGLTGAAVAGGTGAAGELLTSTPAEAETPAAPAAPAAPASGPTKAKPTPAAVIAPLAVPPAKATPATKLPPAPPRDLASEIEGALPDGESRDYVRGRTAKDLKRAETAAPVDLPALWKTTVEAVIATGATPAQISALDRSLELLTDKEGRKAAGLKATKVTREKITNVIQNTLLDSALRGALPIRLTDALAAAPENIEALRAEFAKALTAPPAPALAVATVAKAAPANAPAAPVRPPALTAKLERLENLTRPGIGPFNERAEWPRAAAARELRDDLDKTFPDWRVQQQAIVAERDAGRARLREQVAADAEAERVQRAEIDRKKATAEKALADAAVKRKTEAERIAAIDRTGRDPESGLIVDLRKVPLAELENFNWDKDRFNHDGDDIKPEDIDAVLSRRMQDEERAAAGGNEAGFTLGGLLKGKREDLRAAGLSNALRLLSPKEARERGTLAGEHAALRERTGGFAYFTKDGLAEDTLQEKLAELGFDVPDTGAAYDLIERAMNGEDIRPTRGERRQVEFARRATGDGGLASAQASDTNDRMASGDGAAPQSNGSPQSGPMSAVKPRRFTRPIWADELEATGAKIDADGTILLYHATTKENAVRILREGVLRRPADAPDSYGVYGGSTATVSESYGDGTTIPFRVRVEDAKIDDASIDRVDFSIPTRQGVFKPIAIGDAALRPNPSRGGSAAQFASRRAPEDKATLQPKAAQWWQNLQRIAPGLAKEAELRFGSSEALVEEGVARRDELTGEEEAARVRDAVAKREIFYLFDQALRRNTDAVTRLNLQHEMGHAFWDTLDRQTQAALEQLHRQEIDNRAGPLFTPTGEMRPNVALGVQDDVQEWFAERMAHANDRWAQRRIETGARAPGETLIATLAAAFRRLLLQMRELVERMRGKEGYDDALLASFRAFLNQGTTWTPNSAGGRVDFSRRGADGTEGATPNERKETKAGAAEERKPDLAGSWQKLAEDPAAFQFGRSKSKDAAKIAEDMSTAESPLQGMERADGKYVEFQGGDDSFITIKEIRPGVWEIHSLDARPHGAQLYQAAFTWAHNNRVVAQGYDLSEINRFRRTSNMLSSALRHGTTRHLGPSLDQKLPWRAGDDAANIAAMARAEAAYVLQKIPAAANWSYDLARGIPVDQNQLAIDEQTLARAGGSIEDRKGHGIGPSTLARALLSRMFDGEDAAGIGVALARHAVQTGARPRVLYSRRGKTGEDTSDGGAETDVTPEAFDAALKTFERLERERDALTQRGAKVPAELLAELSEARMALENGWPGWRDGRAVAAATPSTAGDPSADADEAGEDAAAITKETITAVTTATHRPVGNLRAWLDNVGKLFLNFRSAIPELPGGAKGREFTRFRQGWRMMKAATEATRREAEERVAQVLEPIMELGDDAIQSNEYRRLTNVSQAIKQLREEDALKHAADIKRLGAERDALNAKLEARPYHLFRKTVLFRDLWFRSKIENANGEPISLPGGLVREQVEAELTRLHALIAASPGRAAIEESLKRHYALVKETREGLLARGHIIPEELRNPLYFPHLVLDKFSGRLQSVKLQTPEEFRGYLQQLHGSIKDVETDYLTAMYYHMAQVMTHNARQDMVETYWQPYDQTKELEQELKETNAQRAKDGLAPLVIEQLLPGRDLVIYTVDDKIPLRPEYMIDRGILAERLGVELGDGDLQAQLRAAGLEITLTAADLKAALAAGEKKKWILPRPVAAALRGIVERESKTDGLLGQALATPQRWWKWYKLFAPTSLIRYTYGNLVADVEKLFSADPAVFKYLLPAFREVRAFAAGEAASADLKEAFQRGVISTVTAGEAGELKQADRFAVFLTSREKLLGSIARGVQYGAKVNELREAAFRYAKFKADLDRMRRGERPVYAGAYSRDVEAIEDSKPGAGDAIYAKAAQIARKTFVDYDDISVSGDGLRKYWVPFYSWIEGNFRYHANLFRNLTDLSAGAGAAQIARGGIVAASRAILPRSVAGVLLRLSLPYVAAALWNTSGEREELEKTLSEEDRRKFHIILGKDEQGKTIVVYGPTALGDVMEWFGGNAFAQLAGDYARGRITLGQLAHDWIHETPRGVLNKAVQGTNPFFKTMVEFAAKKKAFPDVLEMRGIADHDLNWHVLGNMTDAPTADAIRRMVDKDYYSAKDFGEWAQQIILQMRRRDPEQWGYYATMDRVDEYQKAHGGTVDFGVNNKADAALLTSFRRAIRAGDVAAGIGLYHRLIEAGYTAERFTASVRASDPLQTLKREHRKEFFDGLAPAAQEEVRQAYRYAQRMEAFKRKERQLFPADKASPAYRARFAANPRDDVFAGIMLEAGGRTDEEEEMKAERLLELALRPR